MLQSVHKPGAPYTNMSTSQTEIEPIPRVIPSLPDPEGHTKKPATTNHHTFEVSNTAPALPPTDHGPAAWRLLIAAFVFEALLWGFPLSFGVFQNYYAHLPQFKDNPYVSVVGTTASGISYLGAPLVMPLIRRWSRYRKQMILVGWPLCIAGLVAGSFADSLSTLVLTQGVMYGVGFLIFYYPILTMVDEFWVRRRGMAYGLLCSASGASGAVMPLILQASLRQFGYRTTLRGVAVALVILTGPLIPLLNGRKGLSEQNMSLRTDWSFLRKPLFWIYSVSNVFMGLGYFFPSLYLPSYTSSIGLGSSKGATLLTVMSVSQVLGQFTFGYLSDRRTSLNGLILVSLSVAATATFSTWGVARSLPPLVFFALLYGFFGAGYTAMWARMVTAVSEEPSAAQAMFSLFNFGKGVGNVLAGPISGALLRPMTDVSDYGVGTYKTIVLFTGVCMLLSAASLSAIYSRPKTWFRRSESL